VGIPPRYRTDTLALGDAGAGGTSRLGGKLGGVDIQRARRAGWEARTARTAAKAAELAPLIAELQAAGITSLTAIAAELTGRGIPTASGTGEWRATTVARVLARDPQMVALAKLVYDRTNSFHEVASELSRRGFTMSSGKPYSPSAVATMIGWGLLHYKQPVASNTNP
jgi:hypothetical protein